MYVSSYLELHTALVAWNIYGVIFGLLAGTGLLLLPLVFLLIRGAVESFGKEDPGSNETTISLIKQSVLIVLVLLFAVTPIVPVTPSDVKYQPPAEADGTVPPEVTTSLDPTTYRKYLGPAVGAVRVPVWWLLLHNVSQGLTRAVIDGLPAYHDLREAKLLMQSRNIEDPALGSEYARFVEGCYVPAKANYEKLAMNGLVPKAGPNGGIDWPGSPYLMTMQGGYAVCGGSGNLDTDQRYCAGAPRPYFIDAHASAALTSAAGTFGTTCADWWDKPGDGLRTRLLEHAKEDQGTFDSLKDTFTNALGITDPREQEDILIREMLQNFAARESIAGSPTGRGAANWFWDAVGFAGSAKAWLEAEVMLSVMKQAIPIMASILLMFIIVYIPLALMFSAYTVGGVIKLSFLVFSLIFVHALLAIANWLDQHLITSLFEGHNMLRWMGSGDTYLGDQSNKMLINTILATTYGLVPMLWVWIMGSVGAGVGGVANMYANRQLSTSATSGAITVGGKQVASVGRTSYSLGKGTVNMGARAGEAVKKYKY